MKYYKLLLDDSNQKDIVCYCMDDQIDIQYNPYNGKIIKDWNTDITFYFNPNDGSRKTDYLANNLGWFLISSKYKELLSEIDKNQIQYLPVRIVNKENNSILKGYNAANVISVLDVLNLDYSDYSVIEFEGERIYSVRKYAINKNSINNHIFKIKGHENSLFVSEFFRDMVLKNKITGCDFLEVRTI